MICFSYTRSVSGYTNTVFQSIFFPRFFVGLRRICLCANVPNFWYRHLLIACKNWLCGYETWMKAIFSRMKNTLFFFQFSPQNTGNHILGLWNSKIFWLSTPPDPARKRGLTAPCWYSWLLYSTRKCRLLKLLLKPLYCVSTKNKLINFLKLASWNYFFYFEKYFGRTYVVHQLPSLTLF